MTNAASLVIAKCGGPKAVAEMVGVDVSRVHRWTYPTSRGGSGGLIPARHQNKLLIEARARGIDLRPEDFFDISITAQEHDVEKTQPALRRRSTAS